jgi:hypothetical protein
VWRAGGRVTKGELLLRPSSVLVVSSHVFIGGDEQRQQKLPPPPPPPPVHPPPNLLPPLPLPLLSCFRFVLNVHLRLLPSVFVRPLRAEREERTKSCSHSPFCSVQMSFSFDRCQVEIEFPFSDSFILLAAPWRGMDQTLATMQP